MDQDLLDQKKREFYTLAYDRNKLLTLLSNMLTNLNLTDMEVLQVLKLILKDIKLEENRFGFEPEITAKISKNIRIYEVGVKYFEGHILKEKIPVRWF